jgi:hypothetical protein
VNPDSLALLSEADKLAKVADEVSARYATELARVLRDLERQLRRLALDAIASGGKRGGVLARAARAAALRRQVQQALRAAGYDRLAETATSVRLDRLVAQMERLRGAAKLAAFTASDLARILALKELAKLDVLGQGEEIAHALWRTLAQGLFSQRPINDLLDDLAEAIDVELTQARTLYDTTVSVFGRQVEHMKSRPDDVFVYVGPLDRVTRPFCREHVGKVYTREEIDALDNKHLPNVFLTGGGYNCRHVFQAVSKLSELRDLVGTGQRMPEVEEALKRLPVKGRKAA